MPRTEATAREEYRLRATWKATDGRPDPERSLAGWTASRRSRWPARSRCEPSGSTCWPCSSRRGRWCWATRGPGVDAPPLRRRAVPGARQPGLARASPATSHSRSSSDWESTTTTAIGTARSRRRIRPGRGPHATLPLTREPADEETRAGRCLYLLDGLDEILVTAHLAMIRDRVGTSGPGAPTRMPCRGDVASGRLPNAELPRGDDGFTHFTLSPFDDDEIRRFARSGTRRFGPPGSRPTRRSRTPRP